MKKELLIPVGSYECLIAAINNGADAVYLAGKKYGARAFADNFDIDGLKKACDLCHLYGVKIYITVNTLMYENEIDDVMDYIKELYCMGVDALIMQDIGLISLVHQKYPNMEIHASTQMHNYNKGSIEFLKTLGVKRVVFARELSLDYIDSIETDIEKEAFIHGSLCVSYSGQCLFSSQIMDRSANRGACAGMCRLKYSFYKNNERVSTYGDYLLSPKDLCSMFNFKRVMESSVLSLKIEGRMKSPLYVATVSRIYRKLIDEYNDGKELSVSEEDYKLLQSIFYREYTSGFLFNNEDIMNYKSSNHIGLLIGKVIDITKKKIKIKLSYDLKQGDGIRFSKIDKGINVNFIYDEKDRLINSGKKGSIIYLDNFINLKDYDDIYLTNPVTDIEKENVTKKISIDMKFYARENEEMELMVSDGINKAILKGSKALKAINRPTSGDDIKKCLMKVNNTPFSIRNIMIDSDECFIRIGNINELRRRVIDELIIKRTENKNNVIFDEYKEEKINQEKTKFIYVLARNKEQIETLKHYENVIIMVDNEKLMEDGFIYRIPRNNNDKKIEYKNVCSSTNSHMFKYGNIGDYYLNINNHYSLNLASKYLKCTCFGIENKYDEIYDVMQKYNFEGPNTSVYVYGYPELMMMKACLVKNALGNKNCSACFSIDKYYLKDRNDQNYRILTDNKSHTSYIISCKKIDLINRVKDFRKIGVTNFRVDLLDEDTIDVCNIIDSILEE